MVENSILMSGYSLVRSDILIMKTAASYSHFVPVDACLPKLPLCFLHCQLTGSVQRPSVWFSWPRPSFPTARGIGAALRSGDPEELSSILGETAGQRWSLRHRSSWWVELLKNIRHVILILGVWEWQFYCSTESLGPALFARVFWPRLLWQRSYWWPIRSHFHTCRAAGGLAILQHDSELQDSDDTSMVSGPCEKIHDICAITAHIHPLRRENLTTVPYICT